jgi:hypothetical protein
MTLYIKQSAADWTVFYMKDLVQSQLHPVSVHNNNFKIHWEKKMSDITKLICHMTTLFYRITTLIWHIGPLQELIPIPFLLFSPSGQLINQPIVYCKCLLFWYQKRMKKSTKATLLGCFCHLFSAIILSFQNCVDQSAY